MTPSDAIPVFTLFGERAEFPDVVHHERITDRAPDYGWVIAPHRHLHMAQLFEIEEGHADARIDGESIRLGDRTALFVPQQVVHGFSFAPGTQGSVLSFPAVIVRSIGPASAEIAQRLSRTILCAAIPERTELIGLLAAMLKGSDRFRAQAAVGMAHGVLASLAGADHPAGGSPGAVGDERLDQLDRLIIKHSGEGWRPREFAAALSISVSHLTRLCRTNQGVSASAYIEGAVMAEACRLLAFTRMGIAEVGYRLGYADPSYFSRRFRIARGHTPSEYRRRFST